MIREISPSLPDLSGNQRNGNIDDADFDEETTNHSRASESSCLLRRIESTQDDQCPDILPGKYVPESNQNLRQFRAPRKVGDTGG